ncbi:orotate phosphoribosyltransferase [Paludicola sp. MB14-C6]|uniref:orotate phosphoribosyltransferase n=1 Tax=Paludihabitans sp. MB14-C6 TaxID=3070656 RepID=UPI0027DDD87B|nr:orotate phosphoribosyltransferase [Paludicola sp. MB14-C6]WMJ23403.1 orotate phosphoribosyltransferase [Paludicola sp. MB14-C6]
MNSYKQEFIKFMVRSNVLTFGDFTAKSGRKTPYFVNTGNYKTGEQIAKLGEFYANCIKENLGDEYDVLFGPAYKGIPLVVTTAGALYNQFKINKNYCFNRKEDKDHGEGGSIVGHKFKDGENVVIIEDVITAGTAIRECLPILKGAADVNVKGLIISVDRMEKGQGDKSAVQEIHENYGIQTFPIVTVKEIIETLYNTPIDGKVYIDDITKQRMEEYLAKYGV